MLYVDNYLYDKPSILLPRKGSLSNIQYAVTPFWTVDTLYYSEVDETKADAFYLFYYLKLLDLSKLDSGTGVPSMTFDSYYNIRVSLPDLHEQKRISRLLKTLDEGIKTKQEINDYLEAMARQLYNYWFVQYEFPNEEGKPYKSSGGHMVWNEKLKREIPAVWEIETIASKGIYNSDYTANGSFASLAENVKYNEGTPYAMLIRIVDLNGDFSDNGNYVYLNKHGYEFLKSCSLKGDEIIICNVGNAGATFRCPCLGIPMSLGPNGIVVNNKQYNNFLYEYLKSPIGQHQIHTISSGSIQLKFNKTNFRELPIPFPDERVIRLFNAAYDKIYEEKKLLWSENRGLTRIKDKLLPHIMNGQVSYAAK